MVLTETIMMLRVTAMFAWHPFCHASASTVHAIHLDQVQFYFMIAPWVFVCNIFVAIILTLYLHFKLSEDLDIWAVCVYIDCVIEGRMHQFERKQSECNKYTLHTRNLYGRQIVLYLHGGVLEISQTHLAAPYPYMLE